MRARCTAANSRGERRSGYPVIGGEFCFSHDPAHAEEAVEARRLGGTRRRKERVVAGAYEIGETLTPEVLARVLRIALTDLLQLENSVSRNRALIHLGHVAMRVLDGREVEERLAALEGAAGVHLKPIRRKGAK